MTLTITDILRAARALARTVDLGPLGVREVRPQLDEPGHYLWLDAFGWHDCTRGENERVNLANADAARAEVRKLCAHLTDAELDAEIEHVGRMVESAAKSRNVRGGALVWRTNREARAALETERDRRAREAMVATLPEALR